MTTTGDMTILRTTAQALTGATRMHDATSMSEAMRELRSALADAICEAEAVHALRERRPLWPDIPINAEMAAAIARMRVNSAVYVAMLEKRWRAQNWVGRPRFFRELC